MQWKLKSARNKAKPKLTQEDVAKALGISEVAYRNKENGVNEFKMSEMFKLSDMFNTPIGDLFLRNDDTKRNIS